MRKRLFRVTVAFAAVLCTAAFAARAADPSTGYNGAALPAGPDTSGTVVDVTAANAQYVLDGAYGSIDGKTINFTESVSEVLILGRPTKYPGSNTKYYTGDSGAFTTCYTDYATYVAAAAGQLAKYQRTVQNVTFTASDGVVLKGLQSADCGLDVCGPVYDYVRDAYVSVGNAYNFAGKLTGIVFDGIDFARSDLESNVEFWGTYKYAEPDLQQVSGITFTNCSFTVGGTDGGNPAIEYHNQGTHGLLSDLIVDDCTFSNCNQGVYTHIVRNVTVRNSSFTTTGHNAIAVQTEEDVFSHGAVTITDNTFSGIGDRVIRFNEVGPDTQFTIRNNRVVDGGLSSEECMKASSLADGVTYDIFGNDWSGFKVAYNVELRDPVAEVLTIDGATTNVVGRYSSLALAVTNVPNGGVIQMLVGNVSETFPDYYGLNKAFTVRGLEGGYTGIAGTEKTAGYGTWREQEVTFENINWTQTFSHRKILKAAFRNCRFTGEFGVYYCVWYDAANSWSFTDCSFEQTGKRAVHFGESKVGTLAFTNCLIRGKVNGYAGAVFSGCTFDGGNDDSGDGKYTAEITMKADVLFDDCTFTEKFAQGVTAAKNADDNGINAAWIHVFNNCAISNSAASVATLVTPYKDGGAAIVDGVKTEAGYVGGTFVTKSMAKLNELLADDVTGMDGISGRIEYVLDGAAKKLKVGYWSNGGEDGEYVGNLSGTLVVPDGVSFSVAPEATVDVGTKIYLPCVQGGADYVAFTDSLTAAQKANLALVAGYVCTLRHETAETNRHELQAAVNAAAEGDVITLLTDVAIEGTLADAGRGFVLDGAGHAITQAGEIPECAVRINGQAGCGFTLKNVVFDGVKAVDGVFGIAGENTASVTLDGVAFKNCEGSNVVQFAGAAVTLTNCLFASNVVVGAGVVGAGGPNGAVTRSTFVGNVVSGEVAAVVHVAGRCDVSGNVFAGNATILGGTKEAIVAVGSGAADSAVCGNAFVSHGFAGGNAHVLVDVCAAGCDLGGNFWLDGLTPVAGEDYSAAAEPACADFGFAYALANGTADDYAVSPFGASTTTVITNYSARVVDGETGKVTPANTVEDAIEQAESGDTVVTDDGDVSVGEEIDKELIIVHGEEGTVDVRAAAGLVVTNSGDGVTVVGRSVDDFTTVLQERKAEVVEGVQPAEVAPDDWERLTDMASGVVQLDVAEQICDATLTNLVQGAIAKKDEVGIAANAEAVIIKVNVKVVPVDIQTEADADVKCAFDVTPEVRVGVVANGNITNFIETAELAAADFKPDAAFQVTLPAGNMTPEYLVHKADAGDECFTRGSGAPDSGTFAYDAAAGEVSVWVSGNSVFELYGAVPPSVTVVFDAMGGALAGGGDTTNRTYAADAAYGELPSAPARAGYAFLGWCDGVAASSAEIHAADKVSKTRIYAKWRVDDEATFADAFAGAAQDANSATNVKPAAAIAKSDVVMPDRLADGRAIVELGRHAFRPTTAQGAYAGTVTSVAIGAFVTHVRPYAFYRQAVTNVTLPVAHDYLTGEKTTLFVQDRAFEGTALKEVVFPAGGTYELGQNAFSGIGSLEHVYCYGELNVRSLKLAPFRHVGEGLGYEVDGEGRPTGAKKTVKFHLKPSQAADAAFVRALTNGVDGACVKLDQTVLGGTEAGAPVNVGANVRFTFRVAADAPWRDVTEATTYLFWAQDVGGNVAGPYVGNAPVKPVAGTLAPADAEAGTWTVEFVKPEGANFFQICVGE